MQENKVDKGSNPAWEERNNSSVADNFRHVIEIRLNNSDFQFLEMDRDSMPRATYFRMLLSDRRKQNNQIANNTNSVAQQPKIEKITKADGKIDFLVVCDKILNSGNEMDMNFIQNLRSLVKNGNALSSKQLTGLRHAYYHVFGTNLQLSNNADAPKPEDCYSVQTARNIIGKAFWYGYKNRAIRRLDNEIENADIKSRLTPAQMKILAKYQESMPIEAQAYHIPDKVFALLKNQGIHLRQMLEKQGFDLRQHQNVLCNYTSADPEYWDMNKSDAVRALIFLCFNHAREDLQKLVDNIIKNNPEVVEQLRS